VIVDSSALVAILLDEPEAQNYADAIEADPTCLLSAATFLELAIVVDNRRQPAQARRLDDFLKEAAIVIEPVTERQARIAREAYRDYGKGSGHPAGLNFGDCFAYALARDTGEPLLYKGTDFARTDIRPALKDLK
jgi:ribonuclease VapC